MERSQVDYVLLLNSFTYPGYRIGFFNDKLIVKYPTAGHEIIPAIFQQLQDQDLFRYSENNIRIPPSLDIALQDGGKSPDFCLCDDSPTVSLKELRSTPTITFEVGYSEEERKLFKDAARLVACSGGSIRLAIAVKITRAAPKTAPRVVSEMTWSFWEVEDHEILTPEQGASEALDCLIRDDGYNEDGDYMVPPGIKYYCITKVKESYVRLNVARTKVYQVRLIILCFKVWH